jgi:hypothetical protein
MHRGARIFFLLLGGMLLVCQTLLAQRTYARAGPPSYSAPALVSAPSANSLAFPSFPSFPSFPQFAAYGFREISAPSVDPSWIAPPYPPASSPNYWWVSAYPEGGGRQDGYNPEGGYDWNSVGALLLTTFPLKAQVTLDGNCVGTADRLGPFQLPVGAYTLRVEAVGYQPSITVVKFDQPGVRELAIKLKPLTAVSNAAKQN